MTRLEFMKELESLLPDIPSEERDEALQYYNGYFDDAGEDQEQEIIKELGSPARVASIIKSDLNPGATDRESRGYFTEKGYQETINNEYEIVGAPKKENGSSYQSNTNNQTASGFNTNSAGNSYTNNKAGYNNTGYNSNTGYNGSAGYNNSTGKASSQTKNNNTALIAILVIFTFPFWLPLLLSAVGIAIGVIAAILGIIFGFGVAGITMIGVGVALFIAGLVQLSVPFFGLLLIGIGLIVLGTGMLLTLACIALCKNVLPALMRGIVNLCRLPFKNRSVMA